MICIRAAGKYDKERPSEDMLDTAAGLKKAMAERFFKRNEIGVFFVRDRELRMICACWLKCFAIALTDVFLSN